MAQLAALLRTDLSRMAEEVRRAGRGKDTMLAHITPREAALLKARGGRGSINPDTGLPEFAPEDEFEYSYLPETYAQPVSPPSEMQSQYQPANFPAEGEFGKPSVPTPPMQMQQPIHRDFDYPEISSAIPRIRETAAGTGIGDASVAELMAQRRPSGIDTGAGVAAATAPPQEKSVLQQLQAGLKTPLGYGAIGALPAILQARRAAGQAKGLQSELGKLGQEARTTGQQLVAQARAGQLPAAQQQALEAQRLAAMQNLQRRGVTDSTAMQQVENQLAQQRAAFIDQTLNEGMRLINVADQYTKQAIMAGYQADAQAQQLLGNFFNNYMRVLAGQPQTPPPKG